MARLVNPAFWAGRRVFLTGHTGFKGGWLALWLQALGARVTGYALAPDGEPCLFDTARVAHGMESRLGDLRDAVALQAALAASEAEIVFHLAAQPLVRESYRDPVNTYASNVMGTVNLLEAVRQQPTVRAVVVVTTDKCYDNREWPWAYRENEALGGLDPYSSSKACAELVTAAYRASFLAQGGVAVASARAGNVIGGGDWAADRLLPDCLRTLAAGQPLTLRHPDAVRPWQHVLDALCGYLLLAESLCQDASLAEAWNFGPADDDARPVRDVVALLAACLGVEARWQAPQDAQPHEAQLLKLDAAKARGRLGWRPHWRLADALAAVAAWHQHWLAGGDMRTFCLAQISQHQTLLAEPVHV